MKREYEKILNKYIICIDEKEVADVEDLSNNYCLFNKWEVAKVNNRIKSNKAKNSLRTELEQVKNDNIEKEWAEKYDDKYNKFVQQIAEAIQTNKFDKEIIEKIKDYFVSFLLRSSTMLISDTKTCEMLNEMYLCVVGKKQDYAKELDNDMKRIYSYEIFEKNEKNKKTIKIIEEKVKDKGLFVYNNNTSSKFFTSEEPIIKDPNNKGYYFIISPEITVSISIDKEVEVMHLELEKIKYINKLVLSKSKKIVFPPHYWKQTNVR